LGEISLGKNCLIYWTGEEIVWKLEMEANKNNSRLTSAVC